MNKQKRLIKKLSILFVMLILSVTVLSTTVASAAAKVRDFNFDIPAKGDLCHSKYSYYRNTSSVQDGWGLDFQYSDEDPKDTYTLFWLGIDNPNGINPAGSRQYKVLESRTAGMHSYSAYNEANKENVFLYAADNGTVNSKYSISGRWTPNLGKIPEN